MVFALILICFSNTASTGYSLRPLVTMLRQYYTGKEIVRTMPFKSEYPFDEYEDPIYAFAYLFISLTGTICCFGLAGMDGIFVAICLHIAAQFQILKQDFEKLTPAHQNVQNEKMIQYSQSENQVINKRLKQLIHQHQETILLNGRMVDLFLINIFSHFVSAA
ncbi:Odorant receptor 24a, partial [Pseudolycoriella hygida]